MTTIAKGYAALGPTSALQPFTFERRAPRADDVAISIKYCGVCHSDIHQARDEWGGSAFPMVPGHEIAGVVTAVGATSPSSRWATTWAWAASSIPAPPARRATWTWNSTCQA